MCGIQGAHFYLTTQLQIRQGLKIYTDCEKKRLISCYIGTRGLISVPEVNYWYKMLSIKSNDPNLWKRRMYP